MPAWGSAVDSWMRFPSSRTTDLPSASTLMQASCGRKWRMVSQTASCRDPRSIPPSACASSSEAGLIEHFDYCTDRAKVHWLANERWEAHSGLVDAVCLL